MNLAIQNPLMWKDKFRQNYQRHVLQEMVGLVTAGLDVALLTKKQSRSGLKPDWIRHVRCRSWSYHV